MPLTLKDALKLNGVEKWTLTPPQQKFLVKSTESLLLKYPLEWFLKNQERLKAELEIVFKEV